MIDRKAKITDKVGKLLRQAEDVAGTPEEQVFLAKAFELMAKYGIDEASIALSRSNIEDLPSEAVQWSIRLEGKYQPMQALLLNGIVRSLHGRVVQSGSGKYVTVHAFGMQHHINRAQMLWEILQPQMMRTVARVRPSGPEIRRYRDWSSGEIFHREVPVNTTAYRRAWIAGFVKAVSDRLREAESKAVEGASSGVVALYRTDAQRAQEKLREAFPRTTNSRRTSYNQNGFAHGQRDGRNAQFAHSVGRGQKAIGR